MLLPEMTNPPSWRVCRQHSQDRLKSGCAHAPGSEPARVRRVVYRASVSLPCAARSAESASPSTRSRGRLGDIAWRKSTILALELRRSVLDETIGNTQNRGGNVPDAMLRQKLPERRPPSRRRAFPPQSSRPRLQRLASSRTFSSSIGFTQAEVQDRRLNAEFFQIARQTPSRVPP